MLLLIIILFDYPLKKFYVIISFNWAKTHTKWSLNVELTHSKTFILFWIVSFLSYFVFVFCFERSAVLFKKIDTNVYAF